MSVCVSCGQKVSWTDKRESGMCPACHMKEVHIPAQNAALADGIGQRDREIARIAAEKLALDAILLTTESHPDLKVVKRLEIVTAECAFGMNIFKDLFVEVRDIVGGRSKTVQNVMRDSRRIALNELKKEAHLLGANAVIGVDLDYVELSAFKNMVLLVASGTAVILGDDTPPR